MKKFHENMKSKSGKQTAEQEKERLKTSIESKKANIQALKVLDCYERERRKT